MGLSLAGRDKACTAQIEKNYRYVPEGAGYHYDFGGGCVRSRALDNKKPLFSYLWHRVGSAGCSSLNWNRNVFISGRGGLSDKRKYFCRIGCVLLDVVTSFLREFLEPRLLGGKLGISPIVVLAAVYIGFFLFGAWGVILGPLAFSTIYEMVKNGMYGTKNNGKKNEKSMKTMDEPKKSV